MDQPFSKRRRTDAATALSKPFKSPLRRPAPTTTDDVPSTTAAPNTPKEMQVPASTTIPVESRLISDSSNPTTTPVLPKRKRRLYFPVPIERPDPEVLELEKQQRGLQSQVDSLRTKLETATQALNLESSTKDIELQALITKWRLVSQEAADEVFTGAKERVSRMGGLAAWKERSKRDATRWDFDEEEHEREHVDEDEGEIDYSHVEDAIDDLQNGKNLTKEELGDGQDEVGAVRLLGFWLLILLRSSRWSLCLRVCMLILN
ncbi:hypothetical protein N7457_009625 [Penicillium paradoxum]|uniref:uncharacterized protein n=1 Tax=Penicillium paradoxum TaxID=176176 RepID=UPI002546E561|nr:uncharacterized protein N7457_009625 [Penicillium paradoxum]KAJ5774729.1 hypothetical protein N7457_009625 [Penicillium paradoxum]